jgi:hypothetical protein
MKRVPPNLQPDSVRIYYSHIRYESENPTQEYSEKGGITIAFRCLEALKKWEVAIAKCNILDNFCRKLGRKIASNRLNWGDCHRLDLNADESALKKVVAYMRSYVSDKEGLTWVDSTTDPKPETIH